MRYGKLEVICGPMFSGKSTDLMTKARKLQEYGHKKVLMLKPAFDIRYAKEAVQTHDSITHQALSINVWPEVCTNIQVIFIDEVQFMVAPNFEGDLIESVRKSLMNGMDIVVAGLDCDWRGNPFVITAGLLAMADKVFKKTAHCHICGREAHKTFKKYANDTQVELGENDLYQARCNQHWHTGGVEKDIF